MAELALHYQAFTEPLPIPATEANWHEPWSEPVRQRIIPALAIALAASGMASLVPFFGGEAVTESRWHEPWSEPVRVRLALGAPLQQALVETAPQPVTMFTAAVAMPLFEWRMQYQALSTVIPRLLPTPNIVGTMNLKELKDIFLAGAMVFNAPTSGEIGVVEQSVSGVGEVGLSERPAPGTTAITGGSIGVTSI